MSLFSWSAFFSFFICTGVLIADTMFSDYFSYYTVIVVASVTSIGFIRWIYWKTSRFYQLVNKLPGPPPLPIVGNAFQLLGDFDRIIETLHVEWPQQYGSIYRTFIGSDCNVWLSSPELIEPVLSSQNILTKGSDYKHVRSWLGDGLILSTGNKWKCRRRLMTPAFHFKILENFMPVFSNQCHILEEQIEQRIQHCEGKAEIDVFPLFVRCTLDIICEAAMGIQVNAQTEQSPYLDSTIKILSILVERWRKPWLSSDLIFGLTPLGREFKAHLKITHEFTSDVIRKRRDQLKLLEEQGDAVEYTKSKRPPLLDLLLQTSCDGTVLTEEDIREEIDNFMFAGHDTTATAMSWFLYCMAANQNHQERAVEEICDVFGQSDCSFEGLHKLKYLECCIKESLRLYPSAPGISRIVEEDIQIGDYTIPAGCSINILIFALHRNPAIYSDPLVFDPERFLDVNMRRNPYAYIPFSAGPRNCIGQKFALIEEKAVLSSLLRRYKFELSVLKPIPTYQITLKPFDGIHLIVSERRSA